LLAQFSLKGKGGKLAFDELNYILDEGMQFKCMYNVILCIHNLILFQGSLSINPHTRGEATRKHLLDILPVIPKQFSGQSEKVGYYISHE